MQQNGQEIKDGVDIGDQIELIELTSTESNALIFYTTVDGSNPSFTKVVKDSEEWTKLTNQDTQSSCTAVVLGTTQYVKVNGLWYAPHAFEPQCQLQSSKPPSPLVFLLISTHFTATLGGLQRLCGAHAAWRADRTR